MQLQAIKYKIKKKIYLFRISFLKDILINLN